MMVGRFPATVVRAVDDQEPIGESSRIMAGPADSQLG